MVIRSLKLKNDRQYNGQNKKDKKNKNGRQNTIQKTEDCTRRTSLKCWG
jgi:hypothetical protein